MKWLKRILIAIVIIFVLFVLSIFVLAYLGSSGSAHTNVTLQNTPTSSSTSTTSEATVNPSTFNKVNGVVVPLLTYPSGWIKTFAQVNTNYGLVTYTSPVQDGMNPAAQIQITIKSAANATATPGSPAHDMTIHGIQDFSQQAIQISGVPAEEDSYNDVVSFGSVTTTSHYENIYFTLDGYSYGISGMYYKNAGDQYATAITNALSSATLSQ